MAQREDISGGNMPISQISNELTYHQRVAKTLKPLEQRWDYIQGVLLWKKPTHSLCYIIAVNAFFCFITTGWFRIFLIGAIVGASSLLVEDIRVQVWQALEQGGVRDQQEGESADTALTFSGVCERVASIWQFGAKGYTKICNIKAHNKKKFYGIAFCVVLVLVYAYQYLPVIQILYIIICALFFQPAVKYYGVGKVVQKGLGPFYKPFMVQWQNNRTKRERKKVLTEESANDVDSDEEFACKFNPAENTAHQTHLFTDEESDKESEGKEDFQDELIPVMPPPSDTASQESLSTPEEPDTTSSQDTQSLGDDVSGSASLANTASFIEGLETLPSIRTADSLEESDFMEGLEFPDISGEQYHSSNESLNLIDGKQSHPSPPHTTETYVQRQAAPLASSSQQSSLDVSDFEVLHRSEAEGMATRNEDGNFPVTATAVSKYIGKWLGY